MAKARGIPPEILVNGVRRGDGLGGFERELTCLGDTDEHHAFVSPKACSILGSHIVFALAPLELNNGHQVTTSTCADVRHEAIVEWAKGRR